jgi:hypothetical protein
MVRDPSCAAPTVPPAKAETLGTFGPAGSATTPLASTSSVDRRSTGPGSRGANQPVLCEPDRSHTCTCSQHREPHAGCRRALSAAGCSMSVVPPRRVSASGGGGRASAPHDAPHGACSACLPTPGHAVSCAGRSCLRTRARPAAVYAFGMQDELMSLTVRMVGDHPELPAGSVMRCVARAARHAVMAGTPRNQIPGEAERTARLALAGRDPCRCSMRVRRSAPAEHPTATRKSEESNMNVLERHRTSPWNGRAGLAGRRRPLRSVDEPPAARGGLHRGPRVRPSGATRSAPGSVRGTP